MILTKTKLALGVWEGILALEDDEADTGLPQIEVRHLDRPVRGVEVTEAGEGRWTLSVPIPLEALSDGVQAFLIVDALEDAVLGKFTVLAGEAMADDMRAEIELLRAELDMLKRAFRRHCVETAD